MLNNKNVVQEDFQALPRTIQAKPKYRDENGADKQVNNLMYNDRVLRGNTYAILKNVNRNIDPNIKPPQAKKNVTIQSQRTSIIQQNKDIPSPKAVQGRQHCQQQTEEYVEILSDKLPQNNFETQTDFHIDRPQDRLFVPKKHGLDKETQINENDPDLFNFEEEVEPLCQILLTKVLEQSRMEVLEEEEFKNMNIQQRQFEQRVNAQISEMQRLEAIEKRKKEEIQRRQLQYSTYKEQQRFLHKKIICYHMTKNVLGDMKNQTFNQLNSQGFFKDTRQTSMLIDLVPWIYNEVDNHIKLNKENEQSLIQLYEKQVIFNKNQHQAILDNRIKEEKTKKQNILQKQQQKIQDKHDKLSQKHMDDLKQLLANFCDNNFKVFPEIPDSLIKPKTDELQDQLIQFFDDLFKKVESIQDEKFKILDLFKTKSNLRQFLLDQIIKSLNLVKGADFVKEEIQTQLQENFDQYFDQKDYQLV